MPASSPLRDLAPVLLRWIGRHGVATAENLGIRFELSERCVRRALRPACAARIARCTRTTAHEPELFVLTRAGLRAAGLPQLRECRVAPRTEGHLRAVACTATWLECHLAGSCEVLNERELHRSSSRLGRGFAAASPYVHHGGGARKRPDLLINPVSPVDGLPVAVEVELSRKSTASLDAICMAWKHCPGVAGVLYVAAPFLLTPLWQAIERTGAERRVIVLALADADVPSLRRRLRERCRQA